MTYTLGSLFDGSGGFPLAGSLCGIEPKWAAEVEPYPIAVTRSRFPRMVHLGDISKVNGADIEPVDIITFGSPCQDLSVAGKRAGLKHESNGDDETTRSGLFMEAVRIIKEMRAATNGEYPTFALWENVPGAFSSNKGEDFRIVCEELIKIVEPAAVMPAVPEKGWSYADSYSGDGWSLAYRVFDAQYWGVPQRRRRIHLVLDLRGERAREVLFEREGLRGYFAQGRTSWQGLAADAQACAGADDRAGEGFDGYNGDLTGKVSATLGVNCGMSTGRNGVIERNITTGGCGAGDGSGGLDAVNAYGIDHAITTGGNCTAQGSCVYEDIQGTLKASGPHAVAYTLKVRSGVAVDSSGKAAGKGALVQVEKAATLATSNDQYLFQPVAYSFDSLASNSMKSKNPNSGCRQVEVAKTLDTTDPNPVKNQGGIAIVQPMPTGIIDSIGGQAERGWVGETAPCLKASHYKFPPVVTQAAGFCTEHSAKARGVGYQEEVAPTLRAGVTPAVMCQTWDARGNGDGETVSTLTGDHENRITDYSSVIVEPVAESKQVYCLQGNGIDRADTAGCNGKGWKEDTCYTLNTIDRPAVAYLASGEEVSGCLMASGYEKLGAQEMFSGNYTVIEEKATAYGTDVGFFNSLENQSPTLLARGYKDPHLVTYSDNETHYIVRRLTPTECARLQGFADRWGNIEQKDSLTDEEYRFWHEVRNTHAAINGKKVQEYTEKQMLAWYNKLQTDSAEYKMWGNGIALPPALYCMQGMMDAFEQAQDDDWMK